MKIVIAGGSGQVGSILTRAFRAERHEVVVLTRTPRDTPWTEVHWDGRTLGSWEKHLDGADVVINLTGRSVNCRYNDSNRYDILRSRVDSTQVVGQAIGRAEKPPGVWLQASTATIYSHRFDAPNDEATGLIGSTEPGALEKWRFSVQVAEEWERSLELARTPQTRKIALRSAMVMSPDRNGVFDVLVGLVKKGLGGRQGSGKQFVSWIHYEDFVRALDFLIHDDSMQGAVNISAPNPLPNAEFMLGMRRGWGRNFGLPASEAMLELGAVFMGTETELILKSRRVTPTRLLDAGFEFLHPTWPEAAHDLWDQWRTGRRAFE